jgi:hypothetical protein
MSNHITHLSFTRLKELAHSPLALKRYIEETKKSTKAMDEGTLLDALLFTPDKFDTTFVVAPDDLKKPTAAQVNAKKPSPETVEQIARYEAFMDNVNGRILIKQEQLDEAQFLAESVRNNSTVTFQGLLHPDNFSFQVPVDFFYKGFKHRGIKDAHGVDRNGKHVIWDLKRMAGRSGEALVRAQIRANKYDLQAAIYCHPYDVEGLPVEYYIIAVDNEGYVTPFRISKDAREKAAWEWRKLISAAHRCNMEGLDMGVEFWGDSDGFFNL